jgi:type IV/VI secretion system ImpK/VasF family protein
MRDELARLVYPVMEQGLTLKERLGRGELPALSREAGGLGAERDPAAREKLKERVVTTILGEQAALERLLMPQDVKPTAADEMAEARYALACWLDEVFIASSSWGPQWNERKLEVRLFGTNDRGEEFWRRAKDALAQAEIDLLEVYLLCVMLGFRGRLRDEPSQLLDWTNASRRLVETNLGSSWTDPPVRELRSFVPPLRGDDRFRMMAARAGILGLIAVPLVIFLVVQWLGD